MSKKANPDQLISLTMTRQQWTVVFNLIVGGSYKYGVIHFLKPIVDIIEPVVVVDTNIEEPTPEEEKK